MTRDREFDDVHDRLVDSLGLVRGGMSTGDAAELVGLTVRSVAIYAMTSERDVWCPSPDEIEQRAAEVRAGWSESERLQRLAGPGRYCPDRRTPRQPKIREYASTSDGGFTTTG